MESVFPLPLTMLFVGLGLLLLPRMVRLGKARMVVVQQDGGLPFLLIFMFIAVLITLLVNGS